MKIKLSVLRSILHVNETFTANNKKFIKELEEKLNTKLELTELDDYDCDLKLIFIESGGSEGLFLSNFNKLKAPYYLLTTSDNNSLAASLEILTFLNTHEMIGEILHGSIDYIQKRIIELIGHNKSNTTDKLKLRNLGVIGTPSDWLIASIPNYLDVYNKFNYNLININLDLVIKYYNEVNLSDYKETIKLDYEENELNKAKKVYLALNKIKDEYKLDGFTIRCFDLLNTIQTTSCISLGLFNNNGIIGTCEGDIMSMITMQFAKDITGESAFQANPSRIDVQNNKIVFAHCTIPFNMLESYHLLTHFESNNGIAIKGYLSKDDVTILRISSNLKDYFITEGKTLKNLEESNLCRTQIEVQINDNADVLLKNPCGNHHIIIYGKHKEKLENIFKLILK